MQGEAGDRTWQHRVQMSRQIEVPTVQKVLQMKPGFSLTFDCQPPLKEECVRILLVPRERDEILQRTPDGDMGGLRRVTQRASSDFESVRERNVVDAQRDALASKVAELLLQGLAAQQLIDRMRNQSRRGRGRHDAQQLSKCGKWIEHEQVSGGRDAHSCHAGCERVLTIVKAGAIRVPSR